MPDIFFDQSELKAGLYALEDTTKAPAGSARIMRNMRVTDRGGIGPRRGIKILGEESLSNFPVRNIYTFNRSFGSDQILLKPYGTKLEGLSKKHEDLGWFVIKDGLSEDKEFGFITSLVNEDNQDKVIFCNRYDPMMSWGGEVLKITSELVGAETSIPVDSILQDDILESETATSNTTTTVQIGSTKWADDQFNNFYIHFTAGSQSGQIRKITDTTNNTITFDALPSAPGNVTFEVKQLKLPQSGGKIIYNGTEIDYTAITESNSIPVVSAHAAPVNTLLTTVPTEHPDAPRGNRFASYLSRVFVGNVRSALALDSGGAKQGYSAAGSYFISKLNNPTDFDFSAARLPGEGVIASTPYGGGDITDVTQQEDAAYVFKEKYIEAVRFSQDENDLLVRDPLKSEIGSVNRVVKGSSDVYFMTGDNRLTTIGRVETKDIRPETENIGNIIRRILQEKGTDNFNGIEDGDRLYFCIKDTVSDDNNNQVLVLNRQSNRFEGLWDINANSFVRFDNRLIAADSTSSNAYEMNVGLSDVVNNERYAINAEYATHFFNLTNSKVNLQEMNGVYFEGYIVPGTVITFNLWKDFSPDPFLTFDFGSKDSDAQFWNNNDLIDALGLNPLGLTPVGSIGNQADSDGRLHFQFKVYFPFENGVYFSVGWQSNDNDIDYEITRYGLSVTQSVTLSKAVRSV